MEDFPGAATLKWELENSPFSETFRVTPPGGEPFDIRGVFDESLSYDARRLGTRPVPRVLVYTVPAYTAGKTEIRVRGKTYRIQKHETDANNGSALFLI